MNYTSIEQSKHLIELGLNPNTADMYWSRCAITDFGDGKLKVSYAVEPCNISQAKHTKDDISCWSLDALLDVMPKISRVEFNLVLPGIEGGTPYVAFDDCRENYQVHLNFEGSTHLEAAYNMVCWLVKQGYIKK